MTEQAKHTPVTWHIVEATETEARGKRFFIGPTTNGGHTFSPVCELPLPNKYHPKSKANARLIAAAPELLDALDCLLEQTVDMDLNHGIELTEGEQEAREKALAAIAKAKE